MEAEVNSPDFTDILTLRLDERSQQFFERMRQQHYPPALNQIAAHLTLFHTLPESDDVRAALTSAAACAPFSLKVTGLRSLGRGVAYTLASVELNALHRTLAAAFADELSAQDRQKFQPHVVVQNKATGEQAKYLKAALAAGFSTFWVEAVGLDLWRYLGGPWELREHFPFAAR